VNELERQRLDLLKLAEERREKIERKAAAGAAAGTHGGDDYELQTLSKEQRSIDHRSVSSPLLFSSTLNRHSSAVSLHTIICSSEIE
jgi:hypothetical protein